MRQVIITVVITSLIVLPGVAAGQNASHTRINVDNQLGLPRSDLFSVAGRDEVREIELGRALFHDRTLSEDAAVSCSTCHRPEFAHSDGRSVSEGTSGRRGTRNAPSILNAAFLDSLFWDGRRTSLEEQALDPFIDQAEHGLKDGNAVLARIRAKPEYQTAFEQVFGVRPDSISMDHVTKAIAAFERTLLAGNSPFDRYYYGRDKTALSPGEIRGLALFTGRAECAKCHTIGPDSALFTDQQFHRLGVGFSRIQPRLRQIVKAALDAETGGVTEGSVTRAELAELGRFNVTRKLVDIGKFRTPSLRNVALTSPYMHDGSVPSLEAAVEREIYYRGLESGRPLILTPLERGDLVAFLRALTSPQFLEPK